MVVSYCLRAYFDIMGLQVSFDLVWLLSAWVLARAFFCLVILGSLPGQPRINPVVNRCFRPANGAFCDFNAGGEPALFFQAV